MVHLTPLEASSILALRVCYEQNHFKPRGRPLGQRVRTNEPPLGAVRSFKKEARVH